MKIFCAIRDFGPEGWDALPAMAILYDQVILWRPAFHTYSTHAPGRMPSALEYITLFEEGVFGVAYDGLWEDEAFRQELADNAPSPEQRAQQQYYEPFDSKLSQFPLSKRLSDAGRKDDEAWAIEQMSKKTDALLEASRWKLPIHDPHFLPLPAATADRVRTKIAKMLSQGKNLSDDIKDEMINFQVLRDARMLQRLIAETDTEIPLHKDRSETLLFNSVANWEGVAISQRVDDSKSLDSLHGLFQELKTYSRLRGVEQIREIKKDQKIKDYINAIISDNQTKISALLNYELRNFHKSQWLNSMFPEEYFGNEFKTIHSMIEIIKMAILVPEKLLGMQLEDVLNLGKKLLEVKLGNIWQLPSWLLSYAAYQTGIRGVETNGITRIAAMGYHGSYKLTRNKTLELINI